MQAYEAWHSTWKVATERVCLLGVRQDIVLQGLPVVAGEPLARGPAHDQVHLPRQGNLLPLPYAADKVGHLHQDFHQDPVLYSEESSC